MKNFLSTIIAMYLFSASVSTVADAFDFPPLPEDIEYGTPPDKSVNSWVRLNILGDRDHPYPIIWVAPEEFERIYPDKLVVLQADEYIQFKKFIRASQCSVTLNKPPLRGALQVSEYSSGHEKALCIMPRDSACGYLSKILMIPGISWTEKKSKVFQLLVNEYDCEYEFKRI